MHRFSARIVFWGRKNKEEREIQRATLNNWVRNQVNNTNSMCQTLLYAFYNQ